MFLRTEKHWGKISGLQVIGVIGNYYGGKDKDIEKIKLLEETMKVKYVYRRRSHF